MVKVLMVIAPEDFRDEELFHTREELEKAGYEAVIASKKNGVCTGMLGGKAKSELRLDDVDTKEYEGVVFVGGSGSKTYFNDANAHRIANEFYNSGKVVAGICIAPIILANAGLLKGKKATVFISEREALINKGVKYAGPGVIVDGKIVTADGPGSAREFGKKLSALL